MKLNKGIFVIVVLATVVGTSCKKSFFTDANINPNQTATATPTVLLPTVEAALAYTQGGDFARFSSLFMQQTFGYSNQPQQYYGYGVTPGTFDNLWPDLYSSTMENDYTLMNIADSGDDNVYSGISRILMAYTLQITVDAWGKIPYSQAFQANRNGTLTPVYDNDQALYDTIASLVNVGIIQLRDQHVGVFTPGGDDNIYGGDTTKWMKFGHAIKARLYIHQSKGNVTMANNALAQIDSAFGSNGDNAQYKFGVTQSSANPWFQFNTDRSGQITFSNSTIAAAMDSLNDPRYTIFIDSTNDFNGLSADQTHGGGLNKYYGGIGSPVEFITYDELLFMKAEATLRSTGDYATAQTDYDAAIRANMNKLSVDTAAITTYIAANGTLSIVAVDTAIAQVAYQEYFALYLNPEEWTTWRRTGSPILVPQSSQGVPRRLFYPESELLYNTNNTPASTLYLPKVFWDN